MQLKKDIEIQRDIYTNTTEVQFKETTDTTE